MKCPCGQKIKGSAKKVFKNGYLCPRPKCNRIVVRDV